VQQESRLPSDSSISRATDEEKNAKLTELEEKGWPTRKQTAEIDFPSDALRSSAQRMKAERKRADDKQNGESLAILQVKFLLITSQIKVRTVADPPGCSTVIGRKRITTLCRPLAQLATAVSPFAQRTQEATFWHFLSVLHRFICSNNKKKAEKSANAQEEGQWTGSTDLERQVAKSTRPQRGKRLYVCGETNDLLEKGKVRPIGAKKK
jgi:hypothetical protein